MSKINLSVTGQVDMPTIILERKNRDKYGLIKNVVDFSYKENFNAANEISFTVYKELNSKNNNLWEQIVDFRNVFIPEYNELFEIYSDTQEEDGTIYKTVTGKSLGEVELSNVKLYNVEINTENDISNPLYDTNLPTIFYRNPDRWDDPTYISWSTLDKNNPDKYKDLTGKQKRDLLKRASLLHRIIEKASAYSIGHVDESLQSLQYVWEYNISGTTVYDELVNTIANDFQCLFVIDSVTKIIDVYDLCNTCDNDECNFYKEHGYKYRGDFNDKCPECGGTHFHGQYGEDTTIFISRENLSSQASMTTDNTSMKNCFFVSGGDDDINAAIRSLNPNGTEYIYVFNEDTFHDMPSELVQKIQSYDALANEYMNNHPYIISQDIAQRYNDVIDYLIEIFGEYHDTNKNGISFKKITYDNSVNQYAIIGHNQLINYIYDSTDLANFLKISMCPTRDTDKQDIDYSIKSIENGFKNDFNNIVGVDTINKSESSIEKIIKNSAKLYYNSGLYNLDIETQSYVKNTTTKQATWTGSIILESYDEFEDEQNTTPVKRTLSVTFTIDENYEYYIRQCIAIGVKDMDTKEEYNFLSLDYKGGDEGFSERLHLYSYDELENLLSSFEMLQNIIVESGLDDDSSLSEQTKTNYYNIYTSRIEQIQKEITKRDYQLQAVYALYQFDTTNASGILQYYNNDTKTKLNFQDYIGTDLWNVFCAYRREDEYSNENYISTGLNNTQLIARAKELLEFAKKELYKASHPEITISTTVNNLLLLPEFKPLTQYFNLGNWIRVSVDDKIYKLRLLSYQVNYSSISEISVEFSNVREIWDGSYSDIKSIIDSASSITSSYDGIKQQVNKNTSATTVIDEISTVGINGAKMPYISDNKQKIVIDEKGILARRYDDINEVYDENQLKIISNGLYTTSNGWDTIDTGIGKISYYDPIKKQYVDDYGIIAKTVVGNLIIGKDLVISNGTEKEEPTIIIDENGLEIKKGYLSILDNKYGSCIEIDPMRLNSNSKYMFYAGRPKKYETFTKFSSAFCITCSNEEYAKELYSRLKEVKDKNERFYISPEKFDEVILQDFDISEDENIEITEKKYNSGYLQYLNIYQNTKILFNISTDKEGNFPISTNDYDNGGTLIYGYEINFGIQDDGKINAVKGELGGYSFNKNIMERNDKFDIVSDSEFKINYTRIDSVLDFIHKDVVDNKSTSERYFRVNRYGYTKISDLTVDNASISNLSLDDGAIQTSDRNKKTDIELISDKYEKMFNSLEAVSYRYKDGIRTHLGFISQDVEKSMKYASLTDLDFAGFCKDQKTIESDDDENYISELVYDEDGNPIYDYFLRYNEFIALNTHMIQKTRKELFEVKSELNELKEKLNIALLTIGKLTSKK